MKKIVALFLLLCFGYTIVAQKPALLNLKFEQNYTPTYPEIIEMYRQLDQHYENAVLTEQGSTDCGKPLHLFIINNEAEFDPDKIKASGKAVLLINNGIHPGEPAGIDASLWFADDLLRNRKGMDSLLENTVILIVPVYNIGGHLNRSAYNRSGQTTPSETGFRGNYANLDLNRDFTKCDSENARSLTRLFAEWDPDIFLDTHTTNGSDHQYSITLIPPAPALFPSTMESYIRNSLLPGLYRGMKQGSYELIPYVDYIYDDPKKGIAMGQEGARYSSGYASLFHCYGMITENQIYRNYPDRVKSCRQFIDVLAKYTATNHLALKESRRRGIRESMELTRYTVAHQLDTTQFEWIEFKGYEVDKTQISPVTGLERFGYDTRKPYTENIKYFTTYLPAETVPVPEFYVVPQNYRRVVESLDRLKIRYSWLKNDSLIAVSVDYIDEVSSPDRPYNGHYYHSHVVTSSQKQTIQYFAGDIVIPVRQEKIRYLLEMFEPKAKDSFFRWNFFDNILDQREYFSSYGFEENALKYLHDHPVFAAKFEAAQQANPEMARNHRAQLAWIYNNSEWLEKSWKRYPVGKIF